MVNQQLALLLAWRWFFDHCACWFPHPFCSLQIWSSCQIILRGQFYIISLWQLYFLRCDPQRCHPVLFSLAPVIGEHLADLAPWVANCLSTPSRMVRAEKAWPVRLKMRYPEIMVLHRFPHWMCRSWGITLILGRTHTVLYYCNPMKSYYICRNNWWKIKNIRMIQNGSKHVKIKLSNDPSESQQRNHGSEPVTCSPLLRIQWRHPGSVWNCCRKKVCP